METMKADNEAALAKNESAIDRFRLSTVEAIGGLRTENVKAIGELRTTMFVQMISVAALVVAAVGVLIGYLQFFR